MRQKIKQHIKSDTVEYSRILQEYYNSNICTKYFLEYNNMRLLTVDEKKIFTKQDNNYITKMKMDKEEQKKACSTCKILKNIDKFNKGAYNCKICNREKHIERKKRWPIKLWQPYFKNIREKNWKLLITRISNWKEAEFEKIFENIKYRVENWDPSCNSIAKKELYNLESMLKTYKKRAKNI